VAAAISAVMLHPALQRRAIMLGKAMLLQQLCAQLSTQRQLQSPQ
jgi:hypothetical protein